MRRQQMRISLSYLWLVSVAVGLSLTSCSGTVRQKKTSPYPASTETVVSKKGPPPHAPAHGYRHKHGNVILVYQSSLGIYAVDGHKDYYFHEGDFYRSHKGKWQMSVHFEGPWKKVSKSKLPKELNNTQHAKAKTKK